MSEFQIYTRRHNHCLSHTWGVFKWLIAKVCVGGYWNCKLLSLIKAVLACLLQMKIGIVRGKFMGTISAQAQISYLIEQTMLAGEQGQENGTQRIITLHNVPLLGMVIFFHMFSCANSDAWSKLKTLCNAIACTCIKTETLRWPILPDNDFRECLQIDLKVYSLGIRFWVMTF